MYNSIRDLMGRIVSKYANKDNKVNMSDVDVVSFFVMFLIVHYDFMCMKT